MPNKKNKKNGSNNNGSNNTSGKKDFDKKDFQPKEEAGVPTRNDWSFYAASEQIAKDIASIPFNYLGGTPFGVTATTTKADGTTVSGSCTAAIPAVMRILYTNGFSVGNSGTNAINMAAAQLYTKVRQSNSGAKNYEAADLMMYVLAMRDIYSQFFRIKKVLGFTGLYSMYNHNIPAVLFASQDIDAEDTRSNFANYRGQLNLVARKINSFKVPKYFKAFDRAAFINSFVFMDSDSVRGQMYDFVPDGYYKWSGTASEKGTSLVYTRNYSTTVAQLLENLNDQIDALFLDTDALTMSGDIDKAFPDSELYKILETPEDYVVDLVYDMDVLAQIENMITVLPFDLARGAYAMNFDVTQDSQLIAFNPKIRITNPMDYVALDTIAFNSHKANPDYKDVLEWTRLIPVVTAVRADSATGLKIMNCGLEIPLSCSILGYEYTSSGSNIVVSPFQQHQFVASGGMIAKVSANVAHFDWHPMIYVQGGSGSMTVPFGESKNITLLPAEIITRINDAATYGAFYASGFAQAK